MLKKMFAALLALSLLMTSVTGITETTGDVIEDFGGITLTVWKPLWWTSVVTSDYENECWKEVEKKFNVKFEFIQPSVGSEQEQFNLLMAGGDLPDIIFTDWSGTDLYTGGLDKYIEEGVLVDLKAHSEWIPNYLHCIETYVTPEEQKEFYTDSGYMTQFYAISPYEEYSCNGLLLRQDWLDELGLAQPTTLDELEVILTQFKEVKGADYPMMFPSDGIDDESGYFLSAYGIGPGFYQDNGVVKYGPSEPAFKEYLLKMADWYQKGLIDVDFVSRDQETYRRILTTSETGAVIDSPDNVYTYMKDVGMMTGGTYPMQKEGETAHYRYKMYQCRPPYCAAVTTECKNLEAAMTILDYGYCEPGWMMYNYGIEGLTYNMVDGVAVYTDVILNNPDYPSLLDSFARYKWHIGPFLRFEHEADAAITQENMGTRKAWTENAQSDQVMPLITLTSSEGSEYASIMTQVKTYQDAAVVNFIMGNKSIEDEFDAYIGDLKKLNIDRAIEIKQAALDRYNAR